MRMATTLPATAAAATTATKTKLKFAGPLGQGVLDPEIAGCALFFNFLIPRAWAALRVASLGRYSASPGEKD